MSDGTIHLFRGEGKGALAWAGVPPFNVGNHLLGSRNAPDSPCHASLFPPPAAAGDGSAAGARHVASPGERADLRETVNFVNFTAQKRGWFGGRARGRAVRQGRRRALAALQHVA
jgi:hypothetical protein